MELVPSRSVGPTIRLFDRMPEGLDLRDEATLEGLLATADTLIARSDSLDSLSEVECLLAANPGDWPLAAHVVAKLARSKALLEARRKPLDLSVVLAVFREHDRMRSPHEHELGEGFLDRKLRQLSWLTQGLSNARHDLWIVDDGCPHGSGHLAREILAARHPKAPAQVLFLEDAIRAGHPVTRPMQSTEESRKGGSIQLGLYEATREARPDQVALFTDADLSTHLGQSGLLIGALDRPAANVAVGSRRAATSIVVKSGARNTRGRLFIYLWKKMLPEIRYVDDTQCGFKAFRAPMVRALVERPRVRGFAFDLELLLRAELRRRGSIASVPIAWIDSEEASTTSAINPYLAMLRSAAALHRRHGSGGSEARAYARAIESLSEEGWRRAVTTLGPRLQAPGRGLDASAAGVEPAELENLAA